VILQQLRSLARHVCSPSVGKTFHHSLVSSRSPRVVLCLWPLSVRTQLSSFDLSSFPTLMSASPRRPMRSIVLSNLAAV